MINISSLDFATISARGKAGWNGTGSGTVKVETPDDKTIIYLETGQWVTGFGVEMNFSNRYKWSYTHDIDAITLQHLRYGGDKPVSLFALEPTRRQSWQSVEPHLCKDDRYSLKISSSHTGMIMNWRVVGPAKNEFIQCRYF